MFAEGCVGELLPYQRVIVIMVVNVATLLVILFLCPDGVMQPSPHGIRLQVERWRADPGYRGQPIVYNEDDHFEFDKSDNHFVAAVESGASWGFFDYRRSRESFEDGFQSQPVDWTISSGRKRGFFRLLKEITG